MVLRGRSEDNSQAGQGSPRTQAETPSTRSSVVSAPSTPLPLARQHRASHRTPGAAQARGDRPYGHRGTQAPMPQASQPSPSKTENMHNLLARQVHRSNPAHTHTPPGRDATPRGHKMGGSGWVRRCPLRCPCGAQNLGIMISIVLIDQRLLKALPVDVLAQDDLEGEHLWELGHKLLKVDVP